MGLTFAIESAVSSAWDSLRRPLADYADPDGRARPQRSYVITRTGDPYLVRVGTRTVFRGASVGSLVDFILWDVNARALEAIGERLVLHAAGAARTDGAVLLPGVANAGKSTTVAALLRSGDFSYLSDEAVLIDQRTLLAESFHRPVRLDHRSLDLVFKGAIPEEVEFGEGFGSHVLPSDLGSAGTSSPVPVRAIVTPRLARSAKTEISSISKAEMLEMVTRRCLNLTRWKADGFYALSRLVASADCYRLDLGDLWEGVAALRSLFDLAEPEEKVA